MKKNQGQPADALRVVSATGRSAAELRRYAQERLSEKRKSQGSEAGHQSTADDTARLVHELQIHQIELEMQNEELQQARAQAEALLAQYTDLYDFAPAGYLTFDREGAIRQVNLSGARLLGVERSRLVNRHFGLFVAEGNRRAFDTFLTQAFATESKQTCEVALAKQGQPPLTVAIEAALAPDHGECRAVVMDVTVLKRAEEALRQQAAKLSLTSKYKSEFLANMSHELRTPLNSLLILSQQLEENAEKNLTEKQVEFAHTIRGAGSDLLSLINDILDLSKIESGTTTLDVSTVALADVAEVTEHNFRHVADQKKLQYSVETAPDVPTAIQTDRKRLDQVLKNLLSNAFKFTEKGKVELKMSLATSGWSTDHKHLRRAKGVIAFSVSDTGIGIAADKRRIIFEAFQQADGGTARKYGGTGLGLAISREIAILLGGELRLTASQARAGSTFTLYLPLDYQPPQPTPDVAAGFQPGVPGEAKDSRFTPSPRGKMPRDRAGRVPAAAAPDEPADDRANLAPGDKVVLIIEDDLHTSDAVLEGKTVMVVDDDVRNLFALTTVLEAHRMKLVTAEEGREALKLLEQTPQVDVVLMDIMMPEMDGYETMRAVRKQAKSKTLPIIALTAKAMKGDREKCIEAGANDYIAKPVDPDQLMSLLRVWLYR